MNVLVTRLGAMGDVIHALPAVAALKCIPGARITWVIEPRWVPLIAGNPAVDEVLELNRRDWSSVRACWRRLRRGRADVAVDLQGLLKSAVVGWVAGARHRIGFHRSQARESGASVFYSDPVLTTSPHVVDRNLELAAAAGATERRPVFWLPKGESEGRLPEEPFVLACPLAGWRSKQWPLQYYSEVAQTLRREGYVLVVNGPESSRTELMRVQGAEVHVSGIPGLIEASRRASAVIGVDSGPLHLAAALSRPGVAVFGPTDPARNGPYGNSITVLRNPAARTSYERLPEIADSMHAVTPGAVMDALRARLATEVAG